MKNIHVLPTDKPSRLSILNNGKLNFGAEFISSSNSKAQNIYITNDEEIKEGDWFLYNNNSISKSYKLFHVKFDNPKKIILTTDRDLIKDGVQAIDYEFLEWFVKNPTCEYVELKGYAIILPGESCDCDNKCDTCKEEEPKQKRMYSEEDMRISFDANIKDWISFEEFIEQFKNK